MYQCRDTTQKLSLITWKSCIGVTTVILTDVLELETLIEVSEGTMNVWVASQAPKIVKLENFNSGIGIEKGY